MPVLRDQPVLTNELGRRARLRVLERYTLTHNIDALEKLYAELLDMTSFKSIKPIHDSAQQPQSLLPLTPNGRQLSQDDVAP